MLRCPQCRSRRTTFKLMAAHIRSSGHALCDCGGYHFKHRPGSTFCDKNEMAPLYRASRDGATEAQVLDIMVEVAWAKTMRQVSADLLRVNNTCPF